MKSGAKQFSAEGADRKRAVVTLAVALALSVVFLYLLFLFWAVLQPLCLRILQTHTPAAFTLSAGPVVLVGVFLSMMLAVFFGTGLQERHRRHKRLLC